MPLTTTYGTIVPQVGNLCLRQLWEAVQARTTDPTDHDVKEMLDACAFAAPLQVQLWGCLLERLTCGMESRELAATLRDFLATTDLALTAMRLVLETASRLPPRLDLNQADLQRLPDQVKQIDTIREKTQALLADLEQPWPPLDPSRIPAGTGRGLSLQETLADL